MSTNQRKIQMTVRLEPAVFRAAQEFERRTGTPRSVLVAEAAKQVFLPPPHESPETRMENLSKRVLTRLNALERTLGTELQTIKELLGLGLRAYFNHTPAIPESERDAASLSGRARFARLIDLLNQNLHDGATILNDTETHHAT